MSTFFTKLLLSLLLGNALFLTTLQADLSSLDGVTVPEDKAIIYFFRAKKIGGGAIQFHVHDLDGKPVGYLGKKGDSFYIEVEPGTHQYWSRAASRSDVVIKTEAGKIYYVRATTKMGLLIGRPILQQVSREDAY